MATNQLPIQVQGVQTTPISVTLHMVTPNCSSVGTDMMGSQGNWIHKHKKMYPLPEFHGEPEEWQMFKKSFVSTTREFEYSNLHNIMRLRDAIY